MSKFIMMVGLPASGKSTLAQELKEKHNAVILSSDELREELLGDVNRQDQNTNVFEVMNKRAKQFLESGQNVIYDATNINRKRRMHLIKNELKADEYHVYYINKGLGSCYYNDNQRNRKVGFDVIDRMYKTMEIPTICEGWNSVNFVHDDFQLQSSWREIFDSILENDEPDHDWLFDELGTIIDEFADIVDIPQDSSYHTFSINRHIFHTYKYILENYKGNRLLEMKLAGLFHDLGKGHCKSFYNYKGEEQRYANFIGHDLVSAQLTCKNLHMLGFDDELIKYVVDLVQFHMKTMNMSEKQEKKLRSLLTEEQYNDLMFLHEADLSAR